MTQKRRVFSYNINTVDTVAALADNADLSCVIVPPNREVTIYAVKGFVRAASDTGSDTIELCLEDNTILCQVNISATGHVNATGATFPLRVPPQSTTLPKVLKLKVNGATDTSTDFTIEVHMDEPGFA